MNGHLRLDLKTFGENRESLHKLIGESSVPCHNVYAQGKGNVIRRMFREIDAQCYLMVDGDDTYPLDCAREMVDQVIRRHADMVVGDRPP